MGQNTVAVVFHLEASESGACFAISIGHSCVISNPGFLALIDSLTGAVVPTRLSLPTFQISAFELQA